MADTLPLFPLAAVLLPGVSLPLHIFEPRYRQLTMDLVTETVPGRRFGVVTTRPRWGAEVETTDHVREIGCSALLREVKRLPDGRFDIVTTGEDRFRLLDIDSASAPYLVGTVEWVPDAEPTDDSDPMLGMLVAAARSAHRRYCQSAWQRDDWSTPPADADPAILPHLLAADCLLAVDDRQRLLEETSAKSRLRMVRAMLHREAGILRELHAVPVPLSELDPPTTFN